MKPESVICPSCHSEWQLTTIEMVRHRGPLWCQECINRADQRLLEAYPETPRTDVAE